MLFSKLLSIGRDIRPGIKQEPDDLRSLFGTGANRMMLCLPKSARTAGHHCAVGEGSESRAKQFSVELSA
jgi:hypothetical protein